MMHPKQKFINMKTTIELEGFFCHPDNISSDIFYHDIYKHIVSDRYTKPIAKCNVLGKSKSIYLASVENFFNDNEDFGTGFEGSVCIEVTIKQYDKIIAEEFSGCEIPEILDVNINGNILNFYPIRWLF